MSRRWQQVKHGLKRNRPAQFSLLVLVIFSIAALLAALSPWDPNQMSLTARLLPPDAAHWFGTDDYGRDMFIHVSALIIKMMLAMPGFR